MSCGSRARNRMTPSGEFREPAMITSPSTSSPFANSEPRIEVRATTISPAESANSTMNSSGRLPSVDCSAPGDRRPVALADGLGRDRDRPREPTERDGRDDEHDDGLGVRRSGGCR